MAKPLSILYFTRDKEETAKEVASAIRNEGNICNMVFAGGFKDNTRALSCDAIIVQDSAPRRDMIIAAYEELFPGTEIHRYDDNGDFLDRDATPDEDSEETPTDPVVQEQAVVEDAPVAEAADTEVSEQGDDNDGDAGLTQ